MAVWLYRVGAASYRRRRLVAGFWALMLVAAGVAAVTLKAPTSDEFTLPGTESQRAINLLDARFPGTGGATARIVVAAPAGHTLAESRYESLVTPTVALARKVPQTVAPQTLPSTVHVSPDNKVAFADLHFSVPVGKLTDQTKAALQRVIAPARKAGLAVAFSGGVVTSSSGKQSGGESVGLVLALIILLIAFRALLPAILPLVTAAIGVALAYLGITALSGITTLSSTAPVLATMLGLAVGIDYALFVISRHRQNLANGLEPEEAVARAVATAGSAVVFAGLTVFVALAGLTVVGIPFLSVMGLAAAATVILQVLVALTLLPAFLGFAGRRAGKGKQQRSSEENFGASWARLVTRFRVPAVALVVALLAFVAVPVLHLRQGLPDDGTKAKTTTERQAYDLLSKGFGAGFNAPLTLVLNMTGKKDAHAIADAASKGLKTFPGVAAASTPSFNNDGDIAIIQVTPKTSPSSQETKSLVSALRARAKDARAKYGIDALVTGTTAMNIDVSSKLSSALPTMLILIVGLAFVILMLVFRSILVPLKAIFGYLLTIGSALGLTVWVFQDGHLGSVIGAHSASPIISFLPVTLVALLFGLAMDYEVFLVSRIRENYVHQGGATTSIVSGFRGSARVVTAAAIIMIGVFGSFISGGDTVIQSIGLALAFGVFADAFLVRMTFVPGLLAILGDRAWKFPRALDRALPNVDIEGTSLETHLPVQSRVSSAAAGA